MREFPSNYDMVDDCSTDLSQIFRYLDSLTHEKLVNGLCRTLQNYLHSPHYRGDPVLKDMTAYSQPLAEERHYFLLCMGIQFYLHK